MLSKEGDKAVLTWKRWRTRSLVPVTAKMQRGRDEQLDVVSWKELNLAG